MIEYYPQIKLLHIVAVVASGSVFLVRGVALQVGQQWAMAAPVRYLSYAIDSTLLAAALLLLAILPPSVYSGWLGVKLGLLFVYIGLGSYALKRGRTQGARLGFLLAALLTFVCIYAVARMHDPLGPVKLIRAWLA